MTFLRRIRLRRAKQSGQRYQVGDLVSYRGVFVTILNHFLEGSGRGASHRYTVETVGGEIWTVQERNLDPI